MATLKKAASVCCWGVLAVGAFFATGTAAHAQGSIYDRPTVSPYISLGTSNSTNGLNYFTQVLPQIRARQAQAQTTSQIQSLRNRVTTVSRSAIQGSQQQQQRRVTGHPTRFSFYGSYYQQLNRPVPGF